MSRKLTIPNLDDYSCFHIQDEPLMDKVTRSVFETFINQENDIFRRAIEKHGITVDRAIKECRIAQTQGEMKLFHGNKLILYIEKPEFVYNAEKMTLKCEGKYKIL